MNKSNLLDEILYFADRPEFKNLPDEEIADIHEIIRKKICRDNKNPICRTVRFLCSLNGPLYEYGFRATVSMLDEKSPNLTRMDLDWIMDHYGVHGSFRFSFPRDRYAFQDGELRSCSLVVYQPGSPLEPSKDLPQLSPVYARMLNLKAEGKTQKEIAAIEGCSATTVKTYLHRAASMASMYGFWQIWPESVEMKFTDVQYVKALASRGKSERICNVGKEKKT